MTKVDDYYVRLYRERMSEAEREIERAQEYLRRAGLERTTFDLWTKTILNKIRKLVDWSMTYFEPEEKEE